MRGMTISDRTMSGSAAVRALTVAMICWAVPAMGQVVIRAELVEAAAAREREIVARTESAIEKHRKGEATIRVLDAAGRPLAGAKISVEQTGHDFLFGCNIYRFDRYQSEEQRES
jgi:hypothetical protein